jgi:ketosteroid isomerase-like protein
MEAVATRKDASSARAAMDRMTETAMVRHDPEALRELYSADCVIETPDAGTLRGRDGIASWFRQFLAAFPDAAWESSYAHETGNVAIDEGFVVGTNTGPLGTPSGEELAPTGKSIRVRGCDVATVENGLITSHRFYFDQAELLTQLGVAPGA